MQNLQSNNQQCRAQVKMRRVWIENAPPIKIKRAETARLFLLFGRPCSDKHLGLFFPPFGEKSKAGTHSHLMGTVQRIYGVLFTQCVRTAYALTCVHASARQRPPDRLVGLFLIGVSRSLIGIICPIPLDNIIITQTTGEYK